MNPDQIAEEWAKCQVHPWYFIQNYIYIFNATPTDVSGGAWLPFELWPAQAWALNEIHENRTIIVLKARQIGLTWLCLSYMLWRALFWPAEIIGIFSKRETDATNLLEFRVKNMYRRLPDWMKAKAIEKDSQKEWVLSNGSVFMSFPTSGGRQYTFSCVLADEADFQPDLPGFMEALKPTIDAGGRMILLSTPDKDQPLSHFKRIYKAAMLGKNSWHKIFLPWQARPSRDKKWYAALTANALAETGSLDSVYQEYAATEQQALAARALGKRLAPEWLEAVYQEADPVQLPEIYAQPPTLPGLIVYEQRLHGHRYVIGADPAEGNPTSDESAATVLNIASGEQVAVLAGKIQVDVFADYLNTLSEYYNGAHVLIERNNHGHAVISSMNNTYPAVTLLPGHDGKPGWLSTTLGKSLLYSRAAETLKENDAILHDWTTQDQLASIEGGSLRAPEGLFDDRADAWALANTARATAITEDGTLLSAFAYL